MSTTAWIADARAIVQRLAERDLVPLAAPALTTAERDRFAECADLGDLVFNLQHDALAARDSAPRQAWASARIAYELARAYANIKVQAETAFILADILNLFGEFHDALTLCDQQPRARIQTAFAETFLGELARASANLALARANPLTPALRAQCDWIDARILRDQGRYDHAETLLAQARDAFREAGVPLDAARCERELAHSYLLHSHGDATALLARARETFAAAHCLTDIALCDFLRAQGLQKLNRNVESIELLQRIRAQFSAQTMHFHTARCDMELGINHLHLNHFDAALQALHQARDYFLAHNIRVYISACDINLGNTYYALNRYDEALAMYEQAAELVLAEQRVVRGALIQENIALIYAKQGRFAQSLDLHARARAVFAEKNMTTITAMCDANAAAVYRQLGQTDQAIEHLHRARALFAQEHLPLYLVECDLELTDVHLARGETTQAQQYAQGARAVCIEQKLESFTAICDRLLAQLTAEPARAYAWLAASRATFIKQLQPVDAALCDLTEGELRLRWNDLIGARERLTQAHAVLAPGFPDQAWRAEYGLARCARVTQDHAAALAYAMSAVHTIAATRSALVTEQIANDFFANRQSVYDDALALALEHHNAPLALDVIEASKARVFLALLQQRGWNIRRDYGDPYIADLVAREQSLRYQLDALRGRLAVQTHTLGQTLRGEADLAAISAAALHELNALSEVYESVVTQLRLAANGLAGVSAPQPFALESFRQAANAAFAQDWIALDYYLADETLTIAMLTPHTLTVEQKTVTPFFRAILNKCITSEPDLRELIYRGTLRGMAAPSPGISYLRRLRELLLPPHINTATLIISPHGALHALPFHALLDGDHYVIEHHALVYVPSFQVLQLLLDTPNDHAPAHPLAFAVSDFGGHQRALPYAAAEIERVRAAFNGRGEFLCDQAATREKIFALAATGELEQFNILHFATHALLDRAAPHQSRVLLADAALTATDILDLTLNARLVTLSACQTALGKGGRGDELIGLARAFFHAGARALVATLWHVEDRATAELTERFYQHLAAGKNAAIALQQTQVEMLRAGMPPYQWAAFVLMGKP